MTEFGGFSFFASFAAGVATFVSPCILPLIPAYISFITGASVEELKQEHHTFHRTFWNALFFVLGFSLIFILLGLSASYLGNLVSDKKDYIRYIGGAIVVVFGLHLAGVIRIPLLYHEKKMQMGAIPVGFFKPFLVGIAFAIGWTPCVGPILSSLLILASTQETVTRGALLLTAYAAGLGVPFLLTALFIKATLRFFVRIKKHYHAIEVVSGVLLVVVGLLIITDSFTAITGFISRFF